MRLFGLGSRPGPPAVLYYILNLQVRPEPQAAGSIDIFSDVENREEEKLAMRRYLMLLAALMLSYPLSAAEQKLGKPIDVKETTSIKAIQSSPDKYLGKTVKIEGEITQVCQMAGCWMMVRDSSSSEPIMVKVDDGVIVFPKDGAGRKAVVQGQLEKVADEAQQEAGSKSPYRIKGSGAVIK